MRVVIAGAGSVGRSIATELIAHGHQILLIDRDPRQIQMEAVPQAEWLLADACEVASLEEAGLDSCDVAIAATGDDKVNLVHSLLAKTEFGVPRTVARVNHPSNEWLFDDEWGVDVAVSTPRLMCALVEEAVAVGDLVRLLSFKGGRSNLVEMTLPENSPRVGVAVGELALPSDVVLVAIIRDGVALAPVPDAAIEGGDELLFLADPAFENELAQYLAPHISDPAIDADAPFEPAPPPAAKPSAPLPHEDEVS
ncbi:MAG: TrkA family potassium uptake protein [Propionibacteriaceae bacterium]|jgi:trk system potassium uptake protein TrkA|nr:TrkA family potassium uptake protein [Propionibacteriaceae bacterium]